MRRTFLVILGLAGGLVALLLVAVAIIVWRVDPNEFIAPIQARIKQDTGRDVAIRGGIDLELSLTPKLVVRDIALANAPWGSARHMVEAKQLEVEVALLPLLRRRFEVVRVGMVEPTIVLETDAQGRGNWEFGGKSAVGAASAASASPAAFGIGNVTLSNGKLTYRDGKSGNVTKVAIDSLLLAARDAQAPVHAEFRGTVDDVAVALTGSLGPLEALVQNKWPYPVALSGEIDGQKANVAAKLRLVDRAVQLEDLDVALGSNAFRGAVTMTSGGARTRYTVKLNAPVLTLAEAGKLVIAKGTAAGGARAGAASTRLFSDSPLPLAVLRTADASGEIGIGRLIVSPGHELANVLVRFDLKEGRLDVSEFRAAGMGGSIAAHAILEVPASGAPALMLVVDARNLDLGAQLAAFDVRRDVKGGKTSVKADLRARGASLHEWAASAGGQVSASVGPATIAQPKQSSDRAIERVAKAVNPFRDTDPITQLSCAVVRLPFTAGVARIDRSVAAESPKLGLTVNGTLDLRDETINLTFKPQLREGIKIDLPQIATLVRLHGPLRNPQVSIDAMASVTTAARIGAAVGTVGVSEIGIAVFGAAGRGTAGPCAIALGSAVAADASPPAAASAAAPQANPLQKLFRR